MSTEPESFETVIPQRQQSQNREPTFYTTTNADATGYNRPDREGYVMRNGKAVRVKHPQAGHQGDYDAVVRMKAEGYRWITVVNSQGNVIYYVLTNGAGDMNPNSEYAVDRKQKAKFFGWYPIGQCPVALLAAGEMHRGHFAPVARKVKVVEDGKEIEKTEWDPSPLLTAQPCQPGTYSIGRPCAHAIAERDARRARHNAAEKEVADAHANKLVAAQQAQTDAITAAMGAQTAAIMEGQKELVGTLATALGGESPKGKRGQ